MTNLILKQFTLGPIEDNNYLLIDEQSKEAVLIDCTEFCPEIEKTLNEYGAKLRYILLTHGHFDHVLGVNETKTKLGAAALIHKDDEIMLETIDKFGRNFNLGELEIQNADGVFEDGDVIKFGESEIKVIHTSGHTKGGACFLIGDKIFTGDTLFRESVGRTDLPGGDFNQIKSNIENKLFTLDENIKVYPGHGPASTIGHEKVNNRFL